MGTIVSAYQPHYYPRLHYLARAQQADTFVVYDDVQFSRRSPHHRAPIEYQQMEWLSIPIRHVDSEIGIDEARIDMSEPWPVRHLQTLVGKYGAAAEALAPFYERLCRSLVDVEFLRENPDHVAASIDDSRWNDNAAVDGESIVDEWLRWDAKWRSRKVESDQLREEKGTIGEAISERKREDPQADVSDLVADADAVTQRLTDVTASCREAKERRDATLVELSAALDGDAGVDRAPMDRLWTLDGVDSDEVLDDIRLTEITVPLLNELFRRFDVTSEVVRSSELDVEHPGDASEYLARITEHLGGDSYLSGGTGYDNYLDQAPFDSRGFDVIVQDWTTTWEEGNVCALDVLFAADEPGRYIR